MNKKINNNFYIYISFSKLIKYKQFKNLSQSSSDSNKVFNVIKQDNCTSECVYIYGEFNKYFITFLNNFFYIK